MSRHDESDEKSARETIEALRWLASRASAAYIATLGFLTVAALAYTNQSGDDVKKGRYGLITYIGSVAIVHIIKVAVGQFAAEKRSERMPGRVVAKINGGMEKAAAAQVQNIAPEIVAATIAELKNQGYLVKPSESLHAGQAVTSPLPKP